MREYAITLFLARGQAEADLDTEKQSKLQEQTRKAQLVEHLHNSMQRVQSHAGAPAAAMPPPPSMPMGGSVQMPMGGSMQMPMPQQAYGSMQGGHMPPPGMGMGGSMMMGPPDSGSMMMGSTQPLPAPLPSWQGYKPYSASVHRA